MLEKEHELATHQTGHNSGVIHAGIYYTPGIQGYKVKYIDNMLVYSINVKKNFVGPYTTRPQRKFMDGLNFKKCLEKMY